MFVSNASINIICLFPFPQEVFISEGKAGEFVFRSDGRDYAGKHTRYVMEHEGSRRGNVSSKQMWEFAEKAISNNDMGTIRTYVKNPDKAISKRMKLLCRKLIVKWPHMLQDIPG